MSNWAELNIQCFCGLFSKHCTQTGNARLICYKCRSLQPYRKYKSYIQTIIQERDLKIIRFWIFPLTNKIYFHVCNKLVISHGSCTVQEYPPSLLTFWSYFNGLCLYLLQILERNIVKIQPSGRASEFLSKKLGLETHSEVSQVSKM